MRRAARIDANQVDAVRAIRAAGMTVAVTSAVGAGFPDLVVGWRGACFLLELKDGEKVPSERRLTVAEREFHETWGGHVATVGSAEEAIAEVVRAYAALTERQSTARTA